MVRRINYKNQAEKDMKLREINSRLNKEIMNSVDFGKLLGIEDRTVRKRLERLCDLHETLSIDTFKDNGSYRFKPEWHSILLVLLYAAEYHPEFDKRTQSNSIERYMSYLDKLIEGINIYLNEETRLDIQNHVAYVRSETIKELLKQIDRNLTRSIDSIASMPQALQFRVLAEINKALDSWILHLQLLLSSEISERSLKLLGETKEERALELKKIHLEESLEGLLVQKLSENMSESNNVSESLIETFLQDTVEEQELVELLYNELILGRRKFKANDSAETLIEEARQKLLIKEDNQQIISKIKAVLDITNPKEQLLLDWVENTIVLLELNSKGASEQSKASRHLLEKAIVADVFEGIQKFNE